MSTIHRATAEPREVCIANISPGERHKRLVMGVIPLVIGLAILAVLIATGADRWWRLALLPLFWAAAIGFFQWRDQTCVGLAARNSRQLGDHVEQIEDAAELAQVRRQARRVQIKGSLVGVLITLIALVPPSL
jgi:hypothetical protein